MLQTTGGAVTCSLRSADRRATQDTFSTGEILSSCCGIPHAINEVCWEKHTPQEEGLDVRHI